MKQTTLFLTSILTLLAVAGCAVEPGTQQHVQIEGVDHIVKSIRNSENAYKAHEANLWGGRD